MDDPMHLPLLSIGAFSSMTRLSIRALRRYDAMELLVPAHVDPVTGYRSYHPGQANRAQAIRLLRGVDMPLGEIRDVLDGDDEVHERLRAHRRRLADRLASQERMLVVLERLINGTETIMPYDIAIELAPARTVLALRTPVSFQDLASEIGQGFGRLAGHLGAAGAAPIGPPFIIFHDIIDQDTDGDIELCLPTTSAVAGDGDLVPRTIPGGPVAATVHHGPYDQVGPAYQAISAWTHERSLPVAAPPREFYLNDPTEVGEDQQLTRIEWPLGDEAVDLVEVSGEDGA